MRPSSVRHQKPMAVFSVIVLALAGIAAAILASTRDGILSGCQHAPPGPLVWFDEFTGPAGRAPDPSKWVRETGGTGWGNRELQYYTDSEANSMLDGAGNLVITARSENPAGYSCWYGICEYTSARLNTAGKFAQAYGRFEARIKLPRGQGLWPAFWMLGDNNASVGWPESGEIDVMENVGNEPDRVHGALHGPGYSGGSRLFGHYSLPGGRTFADDFHIFAVDWTPDSVAFSVDGVQYACHTSADTHGHRWVYDRPFFLLLNVAVGGDAPGPPDETTSFRQEMIIDYVRVYSESS